MGLSVFVGFLADLVAEGEAEIADRVRAEFAIINSVLEQLGLPAHDEPEALDAAAAGATRSWQMYGYSGLHYLRRVAAHLDLRGSLPPPGDESAAHDPVLDAYFCAVTGTEPQTPEAADILDATAEAPQTFDHLIVHSDAEGYYLPVALDGVLILGAADDEDGEGGEDDDEPEELIAGGDMLGSSVALGDELRRLRAALGIPADVGPDDDRLWAAADAQGGGTGWERYGVEAFTCVTLLAACEASVRLRSAIVFA